MSSGTRNAAESDTSRPRLGVSLAVVSACLYLPIGCLLVMENTLSEHRLFWLKLWTILPGLIPGAFRFHPHDVSEFIAMGATPVLLLVGLTWLGSLDWKRLLAAAVIALLISIPSSIAGHSAYWF